MSLKSLKPSRKAPQVGDLFVFQVTPGEYRYGRVVRTDAQVGPFQNALLVYLYKSPSSDKTQIPDLKLSDLLVPPVMTNQTPWTKGYFETVANRELQPGDVLERHSFKNGLNQKYFDEYNQILPEPVEPVGDHSLNLHGSINALITEALK
ncbi:MAG TPA: Imm26 family immunity protein [Blastocatellia bacterium]|nr:Imm26 family immunity protein [Blastocatellia bacterium]